MYLYLMNIIYYFEKLYNYISYFLEYFTLGTYHYKKRKYRLNCIHLNTNHSIYCKDQFLNTKNSFFLNFFFQL